MRMLVILGHPKPGSFNHALARTVVDALEGLGHEVVYHDLCAERFDAAMPAYELPRTTVLGPDLPTYCRELQEAEGMVIVHPNWWGMPPAVLKGYIDRVFRINVAYRFSEGDMGEGLPIGLLTSMQAVLIFNTSDTPAEREQEAFGDPLDTLWRNCLFGFCGVSNVMRRTFGVMVTSSAEQRKAWLEETGETVAATFPAG